MKGIRSFQDALASSVSAVKWLTGLGEGVPTWRRTFFCKGPGDPRDQAADQSFWSRSW
jgi:hypothetical protein